MSPYTKDWYVVRNFIKEAKNKLIEEFQTDLDSLNEFPSSIPYSFEPLRKLKDKWGARKK